MNATTPQRRYSHLFSPIGLASLVGIFVLGAAPAMAQPIPRPGANLPGERPGDRMQEMPEVQPVKPAPAPILPPYPIPDEMGIDELAAGIRIAVREIRIVGNTVVPSQILAEIATPYEGRTLSYSNLQTLRDRLTLAYVERGYATSGATLPEQTIRDGVVEIRIVEGRLEKIEIDTDGRFRPSYFRKRLARSQSGILNVASLQKRLQVFQLNPAIENVQAQLEPTATRGLSRLRVVVREAPPAAIQGDFDNYRSPSVGSLGGSFRTRITNLAGAGDSIQTRVAASEGLRQFEARFSIPINTRDTTFGVRYQYSEGDVIDSRFSALGIESESKTVGFQLSQPLYRSQKASLTASLQADWREAQSFLFNRTQALPTVYSDDGKSQLSVIRLGFDFNYRTRNQSFAFRSLQSIGVDILGATENTPGIPDGRYWAWLGQVQWATRLPYLDAQLLTRFDMQLTPNPLLPLEQFAIGGRYSVRGYRENTLVRDNGLAGSLELRIPVYRRNDPKLRVELAPFFDIGRSWDSKRAPEIDQSSPKTLASIGLGARVVLGEWGFGEVYWGHRLDDVVDAGDEDVQDDGLSFQLSLHWP